MSPTKFIAVITLAGIVTATKIMCLIFELATRDPGLVPHTLGVLITILVIISWGAVFTGCIVNHIDRRASELMNWLEATLERKTAAGVEQVQDAIDAAVEESGARAAVQATINALSDKARLPAATPTARRPTLVEN